MTRKRFSDEDALNVLRQVELELASGNSVESACRAAGISDATYYKWRKLYGGMGKSQLRELKAMEKENARLKQIIADLELDKLILKESLHRASDSCIINLIRKRQCLSLKIFPNDKIRLTNST